MADAQTPLHFFMQDKLCLIVEPSQSFAFAIQTALQQMGIPHSQFYIARRIQDAKRIISERRPKLLITEFAIDGAYAMDLIEMQSKQYEPKDRISFINTLHGSDSAVAEASEGEVDGYLLKPFAMNVFQQKIELILSQKINPSEYLTKINVGKRFFLNQEFEKAAIEFIGAKPLNDKPALACFHAGQTYQALGDTSKALEEYQEGRFYQPLHYRCLIGEFEAHLAVKNYPEAYSLVEPIKKNYPITSSRLGNFFVAAVFTNHFNDLPTFYDLFTRLEIRTPELVKISSIALLTAGRFFIKENKPARALEYFDMGFMIAGRNFEFLEKAVNELLKVKAGEQAQALLYKASSSDIGKAPYLILEYKVGQLTFTDDEMVVKGQVLLEHGLGTPAVYASMVKAMAKQGREIFAGTFISKIEKNDKAVAQDLYKILESNLPPKPKK
jgi:DNA-binding NarL/FixJ family response regulator